MVNVMFICLYFSLQLMIDYSYIEKWTFKVMCKVHYRANQDKKEAT